MKQLLLTILALSYAAHITAMDVPKHYKGTGKTPGSVNIHEPADIQDATVMGQANFDNSLSALKSSFLGPLTVKGPADFNMVRLSGNTTLEDSLKAINTKFLGSLSVKGTASFVDSEVMGNTVLGAFTAHKTSFKGPVQASGPLTADNCSFLGTLVAQASYVALTDCKILGNIVVKSPNNLKTDAGVAVVPTLNLAKTKVHGSIRFEGTQGKVILDTDSKINEQSVKNASIERGT